MSELSIARPYAEAVFQYASQKVQLEQWLDRLDYWAKISQAAKMILNDPRLSEEDRLRFLTETEQKSLEPNQAQRNFLRLLIQNKRLAILPLIVQLIRQLQMERAGLIEVNIRSAYPIEAKEAQALSQAMQKKLHRQVQLKIDIDPSLIGGVKIQAGDMVIDASIAGRIEQLANELRL